MSEQKQVLPRGKLLTRIQGWADMVLAGGAIREDVLVFAEHWKVLAGFPAYARFLARHFDVLDAVWQGLRSRPGGRGLFGTGFRYCLWRFPGYLLLDLLIAAEKQGWPDLPRLARMVASRSYLFRVEDAGCHQLILEFAAGDPARFEMLFEVKKTRPVWSHAAKALAGWRWLKRSAPARQWLSICLGHEGCRACVLRLLERVALAAQLGLRNRLSAMVKAWEHPHPVAGLPLPDALPEDLQRMLSELAAYHRLAGGTGGFPEAVRKALERPEAMRRELVVLERKQAEGTLPRQAAGRIRNLKKYLANRPALHRWVAEEARAACQAEAPRERLRALATQIEETLDARWRVVLGRRRIPPDHPGWDCALRLHQDARANRGFLRALLRQVLDEGRGWPLDHPDNAAFEQRMRGLGVDLEAWKGPLRQQLEFEGGIWETFAESDPLRIFEMDSLFDAGPGVGGSDDLATIAGAVEANKRVLYLQSHEGAIVGRKLIGLVPGPRQQAVLIGLRSYGAREPLKDPGRPGDLVSVRVKAWFDLFCHEIALKIGARLAGPGDEARKLAEFLPLFAKWRSDGIEDFDAWVVETRAMGSLSTFGAKRAVSGAVLRLQRPDQHAALIRGLLWQGVHALPVLEELDLAALGKEALVYLQRHTSSIDVYRWIRRRT